MANALTPNQQRVVDELMAEHEPRPEFDEKLAFNLRRALEDSLSDLDIAVAEGQKSDKQMIISKTHLAQVHACEGHYLAELNNFAWTAANATGVVAHKGVELSFAMREDQSPAELVDTAIERMKLEERRGTPGDWLKEAAPVDIAELRVNAIDRVSKFLDSFPPINNSMRPRFESSLVAEILNNAIALRGKVDLALFKANGTRAGVLIIELKTGKASNYHLEDLRYYALLETLRSGVPPYRVATFYLDSGEFTKEEITEELLFSSVRRTSEGIRKIVQISNTSREVALTPGPMCNYCANRETCPSSQEYSASADQD